MNPEQTAPKSHLDPYCLQPCNIGIKSVDKKQNLLLVWKHFVRSFLRVLLRSILISTAQLQQEGPLPLDRSSQFLSQGEDFKHKIYTPFLQHLYPSWVGITQTIIKDYQFTKFNQIILICTISISDVFTQPKRSGVCMRSTCIMFYTSFSLI